MADPQQRDTTAVDQVYDEAFATARKLVEILGPSRRPRRTSPAPRKPAGPAPATALRGVCTSCCREVGRNLPGQDWVTRVGRIASETPTQCVSNDLQRRPMPYHQRVDELLTTDDDVDEPESCQCAAVAHPPCTWCCP